MRGRRHLGVASLVSTFLAAGCGPDPVELPTPPLEVETAAIASIYEAPTGTVPVDRLQALRAEVQVRLEELGLDWLPDLISRALTGLRERFDDNALPPDPATQEDEDRARLRAVLRLTRVCPGWADPPGPPDAVANGFFEVTAVVEEGRLNPELWGIATACQTRVDPVASAAVAGLALNVFLEGTLIVYLYGSLPREVAEAEFLLRFEGAIGAAERIRDLSFDFRFMRGTVEVRQAVADGDVIVGIGIGTLVFRGRNGTFTCDLATLACP